MSNKDKVDQPAKKPDSAPAQPTSPVAPAAPVAEAPRPKRKRYRFEGHSDPNNRVAVLKTRVGSVRVGGEIELPDRVLQQHVDLGYRFTRVA